MKKIGFMGLLFLTIFVFAVVPVSKSEGAIDNVQMAQMLKPTLEAYMKNHPNVQVRIWSMVVLVNIDKLTAEQLFSITPLLQQLSSKDVNIRQIALSSIRTTLTLKDSEWKVILATIFHTIATTTNYSEVKRLAIKSISIISSSTTSTGTSTSTETSTSTGTSTSTRFDSLLSLFELAESEDPDIRQIAVETIKEMLESMKPSTPSGGPR